MSGLSSSAGRKNVSSIPTASQINSSGLNLAVTLKLWATTKYFYGAEVKVVYIAP